MKPFFTKRTKQLEADIEHYLDGITQAGLIFYEAITAYCEEDFERFEIKNTKIDQVESEADKLRRAIKHKLYSYMLIPESRGDVLGLIETIDEIIDTCETVLIQFSIEKPSIPKKYKQDFVKLAEMSKIAAEEVARGTRAFFREISMVNEHTNKVHFYESEADEIEERLKRKVFEESCDLSEKIHLRHFIEKISKVADVSESVAERLTIYAIKRQI